MAPDAPEDITLAYAVAVEAVDAGKPFDLLIVDSFLPEVCFPSIWCSPQKLTPRLSSPHKRSFAACASEASPRRPSRSRGWDLPSTMLSASLTARFSSSRSSGTAFIIRSAKSSQRESFARLRRRKAKPPARRSFPPTSRLETLWSCCVPRCVPLSWPVARLADSSSAPQDNPIKFVLNTHALFYRIRLTQTSHSVKVITHLLKRMGSVAVQNQRPDSWLTTPPQIHHRHCGRRSRCCRESAEKALRHALVSLTLTWWGSPIRRADAPLVISMDVNMVRQRRFL